MFVDPQAGATRSRTSRRVAPPSSAGSTNIPNPQSQSHVQPAVPARSAGTESQLEGAS